MTKTIKIKIGCPVSVNMISKFIFIMSSIHGAVHVKKENVNRTVECNLIGLMSLSLHQFDNIEIIIDCDDVDFQVNRILREIKLL